jgi:hypothetical protein
MLTTIKTKIVLALGALLLFLASPGLAQDSESYCRYVNETAQANGLRLRTPSASVGMTQPNTGTAPQMYAGLTGSLSDYRKGRLTIEAARQTCQLYKSTSAAVQAISYAAFFLEQQALRHRVSLDDIALAKIDSLINQNVQMIQAQSATKLSLYALQTGKARIVQDRIAAQRALAARFIPELPDVPLSQLVLEKQAGEERTQEALMKVARQENWDIRWEIGLHRTVDNSHQLVSPNGVYGGFAALYNIGSRKINRHLDAAEESYADWKRKEENDVVASAEVLRQQLADAILVESNRLSDLKAQQTSLDENILLVQDVSTATGITFANQLAVDRLVLSVDLKDSEYRLTTLRDYLAYNFEGGTRASTARISIAFDDGF